MKKIDIEIKIGGKNKDPFDKGCKAAAVGIVQLGGYLMQTGPEGENLRHILAYTTVIWGVVATDNFLKHSRRKKAGAGE